MSSGNHVNKGGGVFKNEPFGLEIRGVHRERQQHPPRSEKSVESS